MLQTSYYGYPLLWLDASFGLRPSSVPVALNFCTCTLIIPIYIFHVFFSAENDADEG